ncbi:Protein of unknown function [Escherichia coli D6-113.11]|nr:Protein of unknown function [Escherichia coli D6-113.11]CDU34465.1 Protein of unknown function [Escherichia coli D6-113.11]
MNPTELYEIAGKLG